ncbi:zinc finger protein 628-like [Anopheles cruzii]|uniref:zinc finger protein 628-like n=1 Tax=Anopheles cruzii TaxID=68878 RepID=UPI0022EC8539|nr:zinc finger protein 628-like [Anopheles cruzii]
MSRSSQRLLKRKSLVPDSRNLCRLCLSKERKLTRFFSSEHGIDNDLLRKIYDCTTVEVDHFDVFPVAICSLCEQQLSDWYRFREKCVENDTILHNLFGMERSRKAAHRDIGRFSVGDKLNPPAEPTLQYASEIDEEDGEVRSEQPNGPAIVVAPVDETEPSSTTQTTVPETPESMVSIALTQLSTLGVRPRKDPDDPEPPPMALDHVRHLSAHKLMGLSVQLEDGRFQCMVCKRTFRNAYTLKRHLKLHTEENLYECEYCGKRFNDRSNWKIHQRAHTGDNLYNCLVCLKSFISPSTLKYHRRAHRKLRSFDCRVCQESFIEYEELEAHMRDAHRGVALEDLQMDEPLLDAANFVKIELEDEEQQQQQQQQLGTTQEPRNTADSSGLLVTGSDIEEGDEGEEESGHGRRDGECRLVGESSEEAQRHPPHHPHPLPEPGDEQMILDGSRREPLATETAADIPIPVQPPVDIKQELPDGVKQEPFDEDMIVTDPRELLMMEEASEGQEEEKESNRGTVILFRCDYCMQIFHFLDDLNAHMELHNGANGSNQNGGGVVLGSAAAIPQHQAQTVAPDGRPPSLLKPLMLRNVGTSEHGSSSMVTGVTGATRLHPMHGNMQIVYHSTQADIRPAPAPATNRTPDCPQPLLFLSPTANGAGGLKRRHSFEPDVADLMNVTPPEHQCTKCSKRFRTEELLRVHEATHENDALVNRVRSCRICNKVFKCELNLQAHMRKHNTTHHTLKIKFSGSSGDDDQHPEGSGGAGGGPGDGARSGSESASSSSAGENEGGSKEDRQPAAEAADGGASSESLGDSEGELGLTSSESSSGNGSLGAVAAAVAAAGRKGPVRKCEICAISFDDATYLEQHVLSHFARNEAVSFIPSADRPFKCTECHKRFKRKDYLLIHIRTHTGERRYKCDLCSSAFVHPSNLITHRKLHSNERPHKCDLCKATFKLYAGLKIHRRRCVMKNLSDSFSFGDDGAASSAETDPNAAAGTSVRLVQSAGRLSL